MSVAIVPLSGQRLMVEREERRKEKHALRVGGFKNAEML
jgi:hypothetical protein